MPCVGANRESRSNFEHASGSLCEDSGDASIFFDKIRHFGLHLDLETRVPPALFNEEVQEIPLRHECDEFAVNGKVSEICELDHLLADPAPELTHFLVREFQELVKNAELVHQL